MTIYVSSVILRSMRMIGEKGRGETLDATESTECLYELNSFMDSLVNERLMVYQMNQESFGLTAGTVSYTIGPGATFSTSARPVKIVDPCFVRDSSNLDSPLRVIQTQQYATIVQKNVGNTYPSYLYYDMGMDSNGYGTISVYPAPSANLTLFINSYKQLQNFSTLSTPLNLPPGYQLFMESNFAIHLAAGLTPVSKEVEKIARDTKAAIKSMNDVATVSRVDYGILQGQRMNVLTGP